MGARGRRGEGRVALARGRLNLDFGDSFNGNEQSAGEESEARSGWHMIFRHVWDVDVDR